MTLRIEKINELVKQQISEIITKDLSLKSGVFVTVTKVDTTADLRYTRVFISIFPEKEAPYVLETLNKEMYRLQGTLNRKLHLKIFPHLEFRHDLTELQAQEIEEIFKEIADESNKNDTHE